MASGHTGASWSDAASQRQHLPCQDRPGWLVCWELNCLPRSQSKAYDVDSQSTYQEDVYFHRGHKPNRQGGLTGCNQPNQSTTCIVLIPSHFSRSFYRKTPRLRALKLLLRVNQKKPRALRLCWGKPRGTINTNFHAQFDPVYCAVNPGWHPG